MAKTATNASEQLPLPMATPTHRATVHYQGHVQGVGFRYTAHSIAQGFDVTGYVRNLPDGRVELIAEGSHREIATFLAEVRERLSNYIRNELCDECSAADEFHGFEIRH